MTEDELRTMMRKKFEAMSCREWSRLTGCTHTHVAEFVSGKRSSPPRNMLRALNLRVEYVRNRSVKP